MSLWPRGSRILRVKLRAGVFDKASPANRPLSGKTDLIGSTEHRDIARQAVRESLVLLKNKNNILPINPAQNILIAGDAANNIGKQSGGWTITWQGTNNTNEDFPGGSSIYDGFAKAIKESGGTVTLSADGSYQSKPDIAIVVFGEEPYAEGSGDVANVAYQHGSKRDLALLEKLKSQGIPVVSIFISGRPRLVIRFRWRGKLRFQRSTIVLLACLAFSNRGEQKRFWLRPTAAIWFWLELRR